MPNKNLYMFIDESGDLGKYGNQYFTIAALCTTNPKPIENIIKRIRQRKLKKVSIIVYLNYFKVSM